MFENNLKEKYSSGIYDIWFIGKNRIFEKEIAQSILNAKEMVIISSFLIQETEIIKAVLKIADKVRVYIITASENQIKKVTELDDGFDDGKVADHIELLKKLKKKCLIRTASHFHAKFILIDPKSKENRIGYLSSANLTVLALSKNVEIGIKLTNNQIIDLFNLFCSKFWLESQHEYLTKDSLKATSSDSLKNMIPKIKINNIIFPGGDLDFENVFLNTIKSSQGDIYLSAYSILDDNILFNLLCDELKKGRKITIFVRSRKRIFEPIKKLKDLGAEIFGHPLLHLKFLLIDSNEMQNSMVFTGNITQQSFSESFDIGIFLNEKQKSIILPIIKNWDKNIPDYFISKENISSLQVGKYYLADSKNKDCNLIESKTIDIGNFEGNTIDSYKDFIPKLEFPDNGDGIAKEYKIIWENLPPRLPKNAIQIETISKEIIDKIPPKYRKRLVDNGMKLYSQEKKLFILAENRFKISDLQEIGSFINAKLVIG